ncbi:MAG: response regulator [Desulfovibrionales bacterium]
MQKILVIDDEKPTLSMFRLLLETYGYTVLTAENGEQGLDVFMAETPPIVLTDIKMPGMDGIEVLKRIKEITPSAEVIVITGHGDMDLAIKALNLDATDFINKPIQKAELDAALQRAQERIRIAGNKEKDITVETDGDIGVINIQGNVNTHAEPYLNDAHDTLARKNVSRIVFNFDPNASINGAGIAILIQLLTKSREDGGHIQARCNV